MGKPKSPETRMSDYGARIKENNHVWLTSLEKDKKSKKMKRGMGKI